jgi:excisionase family DNA binding protein
VSGDELRTPAQLAKEYPVSKSTIYSACQDGLLPHYRVPSRKGVRGKYLIKLADFLAWLESNRKAGGASLPREPKVTPPAFEPLKL